MLLANKIEQREVLKVTTRAQGKENSQRELEEARMIAVESPSIMPLPNQTNPVDECCTIPTVAKTVEVKVGLAARALQLRKINQSMGWEVYQSWQWLREQGKGTH